METKIKCLKCKKNMPYKVFAFNASVKCPHCKKEYSVIQNKKYKTISMIIMVLTIVIGDLLFVDILGKVPTLIILIIIVFIIQLLIEYISVVLLHKDDYYQLIEK